MRGNFPPQINLNERFAQTQTIQLQRDEVISQSGSQAVVAVDLVESNAQSGRRHYVGNWYLVRTEAGWLLDQPQLQAIP
jgi:hypothetical protein